MPVSRKVRWTVAAIAGAFVLAALPAQAGAADWQPIGKSCVSNGGAAGCTAASAFGGAWNVVIAPGGQHAYVAAWDAHAVHIFDRDPATGALTHKAGASGCWSEDGSGGLCTAGRGLGPFGGGAFDGPDGIVISPDGKFVYVASWSDSVAVFSRNLTTGLLTQLAGTDGCVADTNVDGCNDLRGLGAPTSLVMSADGKQLYVGTSPIAVFNRNATTGVLTQSAGAAGCVSTPAADACDGGTALGFGRQAALTPDGLNLYVPVGNGIAIFDRDPVTGIIDQKVGTAGCVTNNGSGGACVTETKLGTGVLAVLPNGAHLYVSTGRGMLTFVRGTGGSLTLQSCITDPAVAGCTTGENVAGLSYSAISPDGADVVATRDFGAGGMVFFARDPASGNLSRRSGPDGCISANGNGTSTAGICRVYAAVGSDGHVAFVDDSSFVAGFYFGSAIGVFKRDFYPQCVGASVAVPHNTSVPVPLSCSDANGDALALSIAQPPLSGSLGAIDVAQGRVFYNPFGGFSGADHFSYQATGAGVAGPPAEVSLSVASPPPPPPPPTPRVKSPVRVTWGVSGKRIFLLRLSVTKAPQGGKAELRCSRRKSQRCPFKRKSSKRIRKGAITLFKEVKASKVVGKKQRTFRAGQRLELRITAPGFIGKVVRYDLKKSKIPSGKELCLPLGANKPRNRC